MTTTITKEQALNIINIACQPWKEKLSKKWHNLLHQNQVEVTKDFYEEMMKAATKEQKELLEKIFITFNTDIKIGDPVIVWNVNKEQAVVRVFAGWDNNKPTAFCEHNLKPHRWNHVEPFVIGSTKVDFSRLKEGSIVKLKNQRGKYWNHMGDMDVAKGALVTITSKYSRQSFTVKEKFSNQNHWRFNEDDIERVIKY